MNISLEDGKISNNTITIACLEECRKDDSKCHEQCHHRQLSLVLLSARDK